MVLGQQKYKDESVKYLKQVFQFANTHITKTSPVTKASTESLDCTKNPRVNYFLQT